MNREEIIKKIEENDPEILGKLADLILLTDQKVNHREVKCTMKTLNKTVREKLKNGNK